MSRIRLLFVTIIVILLVGAGAALILSIKGFISNEWLSSIEATLLVLGVLLAFFQWMFPLPSSDTKRFDPAITGQKLFYALKRRRDKDGRLFKLDKLPAIIPLTLRDSEDTTDSPEKSIIDMYNENHDLLLLGKPGSGKTTLLQQLTLYLMDKELKESETNEQAKSLPIFLYLYDWTRKKKPFNVWLTQQLLNEKLSGRGEEYPYPSSSLSYLRELDSHPDGT